MNPHTDFSTTPQSLILSIWSNRKLIGQMIRREVIGRYKGSILGLGWSFLNPLFMLAIYTFVFSVVFRARWGVDGDQSKTIFAVVLFVGLICHSLFSEVCNRAPILIQSNANYVKKVVFPLEILPVVTMGATIFHSLVSLVVLLAFFALTNGFIHWTVLLAPVVLLPLIFVTLGFSWFLASIGTYLRDVGQTVGILTTVALFLSPVFYPLSALPEKYQVFLMVNPLTYIIEQSREVLIYGRLPDWSGLAAYSLASFLVAWAGYWWFQKTRKGFADVL
ncbi:MAG: ABC transporter permease [Gammaproteobacteria bacterium]|nr:ABC transporter permease [Gammaproteobacteria bacterium]